MIGIANQKLWNLGVGLLSKWNGFSFYLLFKFFKWGNHYTQYARSAYFFVLRPVTLPQPGLGRIAEQVLVA